MIPLEYRLRKSVRLEQSRNGTWHVVSESPLSVLKVNAEARRLLEEARAGISVTDLASSLGLSDERVFVLCEHFRRRGILTVRRTSRGDDAIPAVTAITPVRDRPGDLQECLSSLACLDYPRDRLEVIVVDDGSADAEAVARIVTAHGARLLTNACSQGPSYSRNRAAADAAGEILAFLDSDCVVGPCWLRELTPYFSWDRVGAVGGRTIGYFTETSLDRYEAVSSPLDMGRHLIVESRGTDTFYVPTCNFLVRRSSYLELEGLREDLLVGEDVDFCWRLRASGRYLVYAPEGIARHKHRTHLGAMLRRRADYGTSEAALHALHRDKRKRFPMAPAPLATTFLVSAALLSRRPALLPVCLAPVACDGLRRSRHLRRNQIDLPGPRVWSSVFREHTAMLYFAYFHGVRYYLAPLTAAGLFAASIRLLTMVAVLYSAGVDYSAKRPRLDFPTYLGYYLAEHAAYQLGVLVGCVRSRTFRSYRPVLQRVSSPRIAE